MNKLVNISTSLLLVAIMAQANAKGNYLIGLGYKGSSFNKTIIDTVSSKDRDTFSQQYTLTGAPLISFAYQQMLGKFMQEFSYSVTLSTMNPNSAISSSTEISELLYDVSLNKYLENQISYKLLYKVAANLSLVAGVGIFNAKMAFNFQHKVSKIFKGTYQKRKWGWGPIIGFQYDCNKLLFNLEYSYAEYGKMAFYRQLSTYNATFKPDLNSHNLALTASYKI